MGILRRSGLALDAVEAAVWVMEDNPVFNAGKGSSLTLTGIVEMDAALMDGRDLSAGAVALIRQVKNPIRLARIVMEKTDHVLLAGESAEQLGIAFMLPQANPVTAYRRQMLLGFKKSRREQRSNWFERNTRLLNEYPELLGSDTVGAVAVDDKGNFAAAASTGGPMMKLPGRIGDTPSNRLGALCR
jgi:beta-aspartyl-peptidase (threonine type)